jgi:hypothetical protein
MSNSAHENPKKPREMPASKIGETPAFDDEYPTPEHATVRKRELQKHLITVIAANLLKLGVTNLGVILAAQNKNAFPANAPAVVGFYLLLLVIHVIFLSMIYYPLLDHSRLIREIGCTLRCLLL